VVPPLLCLALSQSLAEEKRGSGAASVVPCNEANSGRREASGSGAAFVVPCTESNSGRREAWQWCSLCCALQ